MTRRTKGDLNGSAPDRSQIVLLILDMFSDFDFPDGARAARRCVPVAQRIARLKVRAHRHRVPSVYINDNLGRWRSDFPGLLKYCSANGRAGRAIARLLTPSTTDYCLLKPKHSGFFATPLQALLQYIGARQLVLTGTARQQCVLLTACDAYVRDYQLLIPRDCTVTLDAREQRFTDYFFKSVLKASVGPSDKIRFRRHATDR